MRNKYSLNFDWKYNPTFSAEMVNKDYDDSKFQTVDIPHANKELPLNYFDEKSYQFISCYRKRFDVKKNKNMRYILHFEGAAVYSRVYLNGEFIGEYKGAYNAFTFDITDKVKAKDNLLVVELDSTERNEIPPFGNVVDYLVYGGIYREVWLEEVADVYIDNAFVRTLNVLQPKKVMDIDVTLSESTEGTLTFSLYDGDQKIGEKSTDFKGRVINAKWSVDNIKLWDIEEPKLYTLTVKLNESDEIAVRFGFRECRFMKDGFYLNGKKIKIRGLNRHQSYPYVGYAMPASVQKADADLLKYELGVNLVRTSHYPNSVHFLDRCDEIGLLVFTEMPSWQVLGEGDGGCSPVLTHPICMVAAVRGLGARCEEVGEVEVAALQGGEVVVVGIGIVYRPSFGDVDGAVAAHARALHHAVCALEVAVGECCGVVFLLVFDTL